MPLTQVQSGLLESGAALNNIGAGNITPSFLSTQSQYTGFKNRLINSQMGIAQRGNTNIAFGGGSAYTACDRFALTNFWGSGQVNTAQSTTAPTGFTNSVSLTVSSAPPMNGSSGYIAALWQAIEGFNIADCYNSTVTLSFWVRSSVTGTYSIMFSNGNNLVADGSRIYVSNYTINAANTWEQKTITVNLATGTASGTWNTTNGAGLCVAWNLGAESNRKGNGALDSWLTLAGSYPFQSASQVNWISNAGATFFLTGVQLEKGSTATSFDYRPYGTELQLCQRYCEVLSLASGTLAGAGSFIAPGICELNTRVQPYYSFKVQKRAGPSTTLSAIGTFGLRSTGSSVACTSGAFGAPGTAFAQGEFNNGGGGLTAGGAGWLVNHDGNAQIIWSAEL